MKCLNFCVVLLCLWTANGAELQIKKELQAMAEQIEILKTMHLSDVTRLRQEIDVLKQNQAAPTNNQDQNSQVTLQWAQTSMNELRMEMHELSNSINSSSLLRHLHVIRNELKQALTETSDLVQFTRTQETRIDKLDNEVGLLKHENQQLRAMVAQLRAHVGKLSKEIKAKQLEEMDKSSINEVFETYRGPSNHKLRHNKMVHTQISRLSRTQDQLDSYQQTLQNQLLDVQRRLDRLEEPNWNLITAKLELYDLESKVFKEELKNVSQKISDFDKVHASLLELREDVESIENKVDKTIPEFRKEISKLDISFAQLNAATSYIKENQENLKQTVKAIAVSVSNVIDRSELERLDMNKLNESIVELKTTAKQHFFRLNDHILKAEATHVDSNYTIVSLPELMGEVKELQPVEREYEDLVKQLPKDCSNVSGTPGTYLIHPGKNPIETWCNNQTTLLQRRYNGTIEFNREFSEYVQGFGDASSEFWLGLQTMHEITADNCSSMRIDMTDIYGSVWYAQYDHFSVGDAGSGFVLDVSGFKGNASDAFEYQNHMEFSTIDRDRDISNTHCAANYEGGWWFSHCQHVNINGKYTLGLTWFDSARNEWIAVATSEMRVYRRPGCF
ncbi:protein scabrous [Pieris rapae]|uniref:protein scabrous n=1 Tax=Pieris rapae TaxID=64459 RepID=UPI001E27CEFF|nr:protein scabrous [Pieris rapae]